MSPVLYRRYFWKVNEYVDDIQGTFTVVFLAASVEESLNVELNYLYRSWWGEGF